MDSVSSYCCGHPLPSEPSVRGPLCPSRGFCVQIRGDVALQWLLCPDTRRRSAAVGAGGFSGFLKFRSQLETLEITPARRYYRSRASLQAPRRTMTPSFRFSIPGTQLQLCLCKSERQSRNFFFFAVVSKSRAGSGASGLWSCTWSSERQHFFFTTSSRILYPSDLGGFFKGRGGERIKKHCGMFGPMIPGAGPLWQIVAAPSPASSSEWIST